MSIRCAGGRKRRGRRRLVNNGGNTHGGANSNRREKFDETLQRRRAGRSSFGGRVLPAMIARGSGRIVKVSGAAASVGAAVRTRRLPRRSGTESLYRDPGSAFAPTESRTHRRPGPHENGAATTSLLGRLLDHLASGDHAGPQRGAKQRSPRRSTSSLPRRVTSPRTVRFGDGG